jgi:FixJ family two-component response regulator
MPVPAILLVDDDLFLLDALSATLRLRMNAVKVDTCDSAIAALERLHTTAYDAVVTDLKMPGMDGLAFMAEVKRSWPDIPVLCITGHGDETVAQRAFQAGAFSFVLKPFDRHAFVASINTAVQASRHAGMARKHRERHRRYAAFLAQLENKQARLPHGSAAVPASSIVKILQKETELVTSFEKFLRRVIANSETAMQWYQSRIDALQEKERASVCEQLNQRFSWSLPACGRPRASVNSCASRPDAPASVR